MILNDPNELDFDILQDDLPELHLYTFNIDTLEQASSIYSDPVWDSIKLAIADLTPDTEIDFVIYCGDQFYDGLPVSFQIGIYGDIEAKFHKILMREFEKIEAFKEFYISESEYLIAQFRYWRGKVFIYNDSEGDSFFDDTIGLNVFPRYLIHENMIT